MSNAPATTPLTLEDLRVEIIWRTFSSDIPALQKALEALSNHFRLKNVEAGTRSIRLSSLQRFISSEVEVC